MAAAQPWTLERERCVPWRAAPVDQLLNAESLPIRLPLSTEATRLQRFAATSAETCRCPISSSTTTSSDGGRADADADAAEDNDAPSAQFAIDSVLFAGGSVWALDWAPLCGADAQAGPQQVVEVLALSTHPANARRNAMGVAQHGPGALQLWGVPASSEAQLLPGGLPALLALLWHKGRLAWDVRWCPDPSAFIATSSNATGLPSSGDVPLQGLLAAVLANGDVAVWAVPTIQALLDLAAESNAAGATQQQQQQQQQEEQQEEAGQQQQQQQALSLQLPCVWQCAAASVGGSLASCCAWLPSAPHDKLLVGCWDGNVVIIQLGAGQAAPVMMLAADTTPIRAVAWQPHQRWWLTGGPHQQQQQAQAQQQPAGVAAQQQLFITASHNGNVKVWDAHDPLQACQERMVSRAAISSALWLGPPHVWITASADGNIRTFWVDAAVQATGVPVMVADVSASCGCVWSLAASVPMAVVAYAGDGGLVGLLPLEPYNGEARHRKSHAAISAMAVNQGQLWLLSAREIPGNGGLPTTAPAWNKEASGRKKAAAAGAEGGVPVDPLPHPDQVLHGLAFSPNHRGLALLAAGGGAGVVRVHAITAQVVPIGHS